MKFKIFLSILFSFYLISLKGQKPLQNEDENNLYWQADSKIKYSHFQSKSDTNCIKFNKLYGSKMSSTIQLNGIVDIPKSFLSRKLKKRIGQDKLYLAPVFCKNCSCIMSEDSSELLFHQLLFDVAELNARGARRELITTQKQMNIDNVNSTFFITVKNKWEERMKGAWASIYQDVVIQKKDSALTKWIKFLDEMLQETKDFATQPNEIGRLILGKPIEEDYVEAKSILGDLKKKDEH